MTTEVSPRYTAAITGASAGIGKEYAIRLAERGYDLLITARRMQRLEELALELESRTGVRVEPVEGDLSRLDDIKRLENRIGQIPGLEILVNNAGFGVSGGYVEQPVEKHQRMLDVHLTATIRLTHAVLPCMLSRGKGYIINISSIAAFVPEGTGPGYAASKSYLNSFSTNLDAIVRPQGVKVQSLCPGYTYTEFHNSGDYQGNEREILPPWVWMTAEEVVQVSLNALDSGKVIVIPGLKNRLIAGLLRSAIGHPLMKLRTRLMRKRRS